MTGELRRLMAAAGAAAALLAPLPCAAEPFAVQLGAERVVLDSPPGFSDTVGLASPRLNELADTLTAASNRILLFAITDADVRRFMGGDYPEMKRYAIAVTPKATERSRVTPEQLGALLADSLRELGPAAATGVDYIKHLDAQPIGRVTLLAELRKDPQAASVLQGTRLPPVRTGFAGWSEKPQYLLSTTTVFALRGRALNIGLYTLYDGPADLEWLRSATQRWVEELHRLNSR